jgi:hypothetical protein
MTAQIDAEPRKLDIGRVAQQTFAVLGRQPLAIFGLAILLGGLPTAANVFVSGGRVAGVTAFSGTWFGLVLLIPFVSAFLEACLLSIAFSETSGRQVELRQVLTTGGKFFLPLVAVNVLSYLGIAAGSVLLIVPGIMLATAWCVAGPALLAERGGITAVFARSAELTRGNRWRIVGLFVVYFVALMILEAVTGAFNLARMGATGGAVFSPLRAAGMGLINALGAAISSVGIAVLYLELRALKGGLGGDEAARVFD